MRSFGLHPEKVSPQLTVGLSRSPMTTPMLFFAKIMGFGPPELIVILVLLLVIFGGTNFFGPTDAE